MAASPRKGIIFALTCLLILAVMPLLANARPAGADALTFTIWLTFWQLIAGLPLFFLERRNGASDAQTLPRFRGRTAFIALFTGALFAVSTYMYVIAAREAGPVSMAIALQAYPLFAIILEAVFLGKRKTPAELVFTALLLTALYYLTTQGTLQITDISWWSAFALAIPLIWSVAHILLRQLLAGTSITPNQVTVSRLVISGIFLLLVYAVAGKPGALLDGFSDFRFQAAALLLGLAYYTELVLWFHAMRHIDVSVASSVTVPAPAVTMLISVALLGGGAESYQIWAMMVIALALYGLLLAGKRAARLPAAG